MFQFIKLPPDQPYEHVQWLKPLSQQEPIQAYALRLRQQIKDPNPILIGLSFGGVMAIELTKIMQVHQVILISSLSTHHGLPGLYRIMGKLQLHRITPFWLLRNLYPFGPFFFGAHTPAERKLLKEVILETDEKYLRWSLGQLFLWRQHKPLPGMVHIHGSDDKVLPFVDGPGVIKIEHGEHLMVLHQAAEINVILNKILEDEHDR